MIRLGSVRNGWALAVVLAIAAGSANAQQSRSNKPIIPGESAGDHPLRLAMANQEKTTVKTERTVAEKTTTTTKTRTVVAEEDYKEVSDFFNIREANSSVRCGEWELEAGGGWVTGSGDDNFNAFASLKYGFTADFFAEIEVLPMDIGNGEEEGGAGDTSLILFQQWTHERDHWGALATWGEMRIPSGDDSSGVDGAVHVTLTKTLAPCWRMHWDGWLMTANGDRGSDNGEDRRPFQYGIGPGFDYQFSDATIGVINYLHRTSDERGHDNENILELGMAHQISGNQWIKAAVDFGLDWREGEDKVGAKFVWTYSF